MRALLAEGATSVTPSCSGDEAMKGIARPSETLYRGNDTRPVRALSTEPRGGPASGVSTTVALLVRGVKGDERLLIRWHASFPTLYQIRQRGLIATPIPYATAHLAAIFIKHFPRKLPV